jgi:hypothetical protein
MAWDHEHRDRIGECLGNAGECILDASSFLHRADADPPAARHSAESIRDVYDDSLRPGHDRPDFLGRAGVDQVMRRVTREEVNAFAFENLRNCRADGDH